jgi:CO/xanthine dehydrogenase FAD-binding subunit
VRKSFPGLAEAAHSIATPQIRNLGTVGGNLASAALLVLPARGSRSV